MYSGGDDVFIVGSWDVTIRLAERIRNDFKEFTCHNPLFSLSGGVAIVPSKFPIMKGAEESAKEESAAKSHTVHTGDVVSEKNSISFMGMPLNWNLEYPQVKKLKDKLCDLLQTGRMPKSFLSKLMNHYANAGFVGHTIMIPKTYWMLTYDLSRMKERCSTDVHILIDNCIREVCDKSRNTLNGKSITTNYHALELWTFAARWASWNIEKIKNNLKNKRNMAYYDKNQGNGYRSQMGGSNFRGNNQNSEKETADGIFNKLEYQSSWITQEPTEALVKYAETAGRFMAKNGLTNSKIRSIYGEIKRIQMGVFEREKPSFYLLKPKVAYALGRDDKNEGLKLFKKIFDRCSADVSDQKSYQNFCGFIEAILAYHKAYGGKD